MARADILYFEIHHWVIQRAAGWTEQDAENRLSALRRETRNLVRRNQANQPQWMTLAFAGRSNAIEVVTERGAVYLYEVFPLAASVSKDADPQAVREAIYALMKGALADLSQGIYAYQRAVEDFGTESPVSYVADGGSDFSGGMTFGH